LGNQISPSVGVGISIPIFQKNQAKANITLAKIGYESAELDETNTRNQLRKEIEQACLDVVSAQSQYDASNEQYESTAESYALAEEKFKQGLINSVDFLFEKTNLIVAESQTLQAKYNLIFSYKILDFYSGIPIAL
jgi:outer membrane protein